MYINNNQMVGIQAKKMIFVFSVQISLNRILGYLYKKLQMLNTALENLIRGTGNELIAYLQEMRVKHDIPNTKTISHCYSIHLDGNGRPRVNDFIDFIATKLVEYSIPRSQFEKAKQHLLVHNSDSEFAKLRTKAETLFTHLKNTGEGGEILLYILVQEYLKIPQLLCKMPLKTNTEMHYHGVDGIHAEYDESQGVLALYWGESKLYQDINQGVKACFSSLKEYLLSPNGANSPQERDLQLVKDGLDLNDEKLEDAIVQYFDKGNPNFNKLQYRGVCLVGFDYDKYPKGPNSITSEQLNSIIKTEIDNWCGSVGDGIKAHTSLDSFHIHIFLIPFPSVEDFRAYFLKSIKGSQDATSVITTAKVQNSKSTKAKGKK